MADQLLGLFERSILDEISPEEAEFYANNNASSPLSQYEDSVAHFTPSLLSTAIRDFQVDITTLENDVPLLDLDSSSDDGSNHSSPLLSRYEDAVAYLAPQLASADARELETETVASNDVPLLGTNSSADGGSNRNLVEETALLSPQSATTTQIENVAVTSSLNQDQEYINGLLNCCVHTLHGFRACPKPKSCPGRLFICKDFGDGGGDCPFSGLQHGEYLHIKRYCKTELVNGECCIVDCQDGHDHLELRKRRWEEFMNRKKSDAEVGKAVNRALVRQAVQRQVETLTRAMISNATTQLPSIVDEIARNLRKKLDAEIDGVKMLQGQLEDKVLAALQLYDNLGRSKKMIQAPKRVIEIGEALNRSNLDIATSKQIETLKRAMSRQATPLDRIEAQVAVAKLRKKLKSRMDTGEKVIRENLKGKVWTTIAAYNEWSKHVS